MSEADVVSTSNPPKSEEDKTDNKTPSGESNFNSQLSSGEDPSHPNLVAALSQVPYSPLFGILWPIIVDQASFDTRELLSEVHPYFEALCQPYSESDRAKRDYVDNRETKEKLPFVLDLSFGVEWRSWGADKCGFNSAEAFRAFCALGDIDPDQGRSWGPQASLSYIWMSRTKDVVFETMLNPLAESGYCHYFGLTGVADKALAMYNFMHDNHSSDTFIEWGRGYI